jgi:hypothetical protein
MLGRIDAVLTARQHRDRAGREACLVRGRVDPARQPRHHDKTRFAELARDHLREFEPGARGVARADRRHHRPRQRRRVAADRQKRRRIVDHLQPRRIVGLAPGDQGDAELVRQGEFAHRVLARANLHGASRAAALRQRRQRIERRPRPAKID